MRKIWLFGMVLVFLLTACGSKKRAAVRERQASQSAARHEAEDGSHTLPEDTGRFTFIPIASPEEYIRTFSAIAQSEMRTYGIPASITLAQGLLESGFGQGELTRKTNNHFGIKCHTGWDGDYERHDDDARGECFRKYNHPVYSFRDHSIFLSSRSRYASLFDLRKDDYRGWARGLKAAGYATDRRYPQKLIQLIERYGLYRFDAAVLGTAVAAAPDYHTHRVQAGDTLYGLSRKYRISIEELMHINQLDDHTLSIGQILKVQSEKVKK